MYTYQYTNVLPQHRIIIQQNDIIYIPLWTISSYQPFQILSSWSRFDWYSNQLCFSLCCVM